MDLSLVDFYCTFKVILRLTGWLIALLMFWFYYYFYRMLK
jgi:hypothetical protein